MRRPRRTATSAPVSSSASTTTRSRSPSSLSACGLRRSRRVSRLGSLARRSRWRSSRFVEPLSSLRLPLTHRRRSQDYKEYHTDTTVHFIISLTDKGKEAIEKDGLEKTFKITSKLNISNMVCFDPAGKVKKYATPEEILCDFFDVRMDYYHKRKVRLLVLFMRVLS